MLSLTYRLLLSEEAFSVFYLSEKPLQISLFSDQQDQQVWGKSKVHKTTGQPHPPSLRSLGQDLLQRKECLKDSQKSPPLPPMHLQWNHSPMGLAYKRNIKDRSCSPQTHWAATIIPKTACQCKAEQGRDLWHSSHSLSDGQRSFLSKWIPCFWCKEKHHLSVLINNLTKQFTWW